MKYIWTAYPPSEASDTSPYWEIEDTAGRIATIYDDDAEAEANARLIAAAPELLAALQAVEEYEEDCTPAPGTREAEIRAMCRAAIAKATQP